MSVSACRVIFLVVLWAAFCLIYGCSSLSEQPGETAAEGHRRHLRNLRINQQEMMGDIDRTLLLDKPSELTDRRIP